MNREEFEAKLVKEFPNLYADMHGDPRTTCMAWGVDTGEGWYEIIYNLSRQLEALILSLPEEQRAACKAAQVKQKLGGLRFYMDGATDEMRRLVAETETLSYKTCETCGQTGKLCGDWRKNEWLYTSCKEHAKKQHKEKF